MSAQHLQSPAEGPPAPRHGGPVSSGARVGSWALQRPHVWGASAQGNQAPLLPGRSSLPSPEAFTAGGAGCHPLAPDTHSRQGRPSVGWPLSQEGGWIPGPVLSWTRCSVRTRQGEHA